MPVVDFHAHILPGVDHGSDSVTTTRRQWALIRAAGTDEVIATPHFYPNRHLVPQFLEERAAALAQLGNGDPLCRPALLCGAEVLVCSGMERMEGLARLTVTGTKVILLEMPFTSWSDELYETVLAIRDMGLTPVLAHIDRYPLDAVRPLLCEGIRAQLNAPALVGLFRSRRFRPLVENGTVVALGSDLHGAARGAYRAFVRSRKRLGTLADELFDRSAALLEKAERYHPAL